MHTNTQRGFTLIELLVVIAIIGLLSSVVLASLNGARQRGRDARRLADLKQMQVALELFYSSNNRYPTTAEGTAILVTQNFIASLPTDPGSGTYGYTTPTGNQYYCLGATLEGPVPDPADTCGSAGTNPKTGTGAYNVGP